MSRKLVERVSRVVDRRAGRRGFLRSSAMAATAMAVAPVAYAMRPTTAEAAIVLCKGHQCNPGALCCDNWSEFCCKITGENLCPPGTIVAGWWKADGSGFCDLNGPRPRYYLDCNFTCDEGCRCSSSGFCDRGCTPARCQCHGGCDTRKSECLRFRYGQCNQDVCVGQLKCRIVTCVPPWKWDPACATSPVLSSPGTRWHDRPCLHEGFTDIPPLAFYAEAVMFSCWIALDDTTASGGTLEIARGSHRWPAGADRMGEFHAPEDYRATVTAAAQRAQIAELDIAAMEVPAGGGSFHHGWAWHGSGPNRSGPHRRSLVLHCASSEARFNRAGFGEGNGPVYSRYARLADDEMDENHFPILWRADGYRTPGI